MRIVLNRRNNAHFREFLFCFINSTNLLFHRQIYALLLLTGTLEKMHNSMDLIERNKQVADLIFKTTG